MKTIPYLLMLALVGCACNDAPPIPQSVEEIKVVAAEERKSETLWMYSTGSFALFSLGLAVVAFWASRRLSGLALMAGGALGMASVWVFDSDWFPWVAGGTVALVLLSGLAFAWVNAYRAFVEKPKPDAEPSE